MSSWGRTIALVVGALALVPAPAFARDQRWRVAQRSTVPDYVYGVSCGGPAGCLVLDHDQIAYAAADCLTTGCVAVGSQITSFRAAQLTSQGWSRMRFDPPVSGGWYGSLAGVGCWSRAACFAVGNVSTVIQTDCPTGTPAANNCDVNVPLLERWNGADWVTEQPLPVPTVATTAVPNSSEAPASALDGVACARANACMAVGYVGTGMDAPLIGFVDQWLAGFSSSHEPFADAWNGRSWTMKLIPTPLDASAEQLSSVSCSAAASCVAVGAATVAGQAVPFAAREVRGRWFDTRLPLHGSGLLSSVSCVPAGTCVAVGYRGLGSGRRPLIASWRSGRWSLQRAPVPRDSHRNGGTALVGVSCVTATSCEAAGNYERHNNEGLDVGWFLESTGHP
jgi:hypothetical protein